MSRISTVYDTLVTTLTALYPSHVRLPQPYKPEENNKIYLRKGWGIVMAAGENDQINISCEVHVTRTFNVVLTRQYFGLEHDVSTKEDVEKDLMEDQFLLINEVESNVTQNEMLTSASYVSDNGIEFVLQGSDRFLILNTTLAVKYVENVG